MTIDVKKIKEEEKIENFVSYNEKGDIVPAEGIGTYILKRVEEEEKKYKKDKNTKAVPDSIHTLICKRVVDELPEIVDVFLRMAKSGNTKILNFLMARYLPPDSPVHFNLKKINSLEDAKEALAQIIDGVAKGKITPYQAKALRESVIPYIELAKINEIVQKVEELDAKFNKVSEIVVDTHQMALPTPSKDYWQAQRERRDNFLSKLQKED